MKPLIFPGMEAEIIETHEPTKGLGRVQVHGDWIDDLDDDGYNVYQNEYGRKAIIYPDSSDDWCVVQPKKTKV